MPARRLTALLPLVLLSACGGGSRDADTRVRGATFSVYASVPGDGASAADGAAVFAGARLALKRAGGRAGGRRVRLIRLSSTRPGDSLWDPGTVEANASRAGDDPTAIAYLGELDEGGSAVSVPVTNRKSLLQVSPVDGLTSLTRRPPGRPPAGPARYYPKGVRTFVRVVPNDLAVARAMLRLAGERGLRRVAILHTERVADRELAEVLGARARVAGLVAVSVQALRDEPAAVPGLVERLEEEEPEAVLLAGDGGPTTAALLRALARRLPKLGVIASAGVIVPGSEAAPGSTVALTPIVPTAGQPAPARRLLRRLGREQGVPPRPDALYGYEAMRVILGAIREGGPDRRRVVRAALAPRERRSVLGRYTVRRSGDAGGLPLALVAIRPDGPTFRRLTH